MSRDEASVRPSGHRLQALLGAQGAFGRLLVQRCVTPVDNLLNLALVHQSFRIHGISC